MLGFLLILAVLGVLFARVPVIRLHDQRLRALQPRIDRARRSPAYHRHVQATRHGIGLLILPDEDTDQ